MTSECVDVEWNVGQRIVGFVGLDGRVGYADHLSSFEVVVSDAKNIKNCSNKVPGFFALLLILWATISLIAVSNT